MKANQIGVIKVKMGRAYPDAMDTCFFNEFGFRIQTKWSHIFGDFVSSPVSNSDGFKKKHHIWIKAFNNGYFKARDMVDIP